MVHHVLGSQLPTLGWYGIRWAFSILPRGGQRTPEKKSLRLHCHYPLLKLSGYSMDLRIRFGVDLILDQWHIGFSKKLQSFINPGWWFGTCFIFPYMGMDQYLLIPFLVGWTSINPSYLMWTTGVQGFDTLPYIGNVIIPTQHVVLLVHRAPAHRNRHVTSQQIRAMGCSPLGLTHAVWNSDVGSTAKKTDLECFGFLRCCKMYIYIYTV